MTLTLTTFHIRVHFKSNVEFGFILVVLNSDDGIWFWNKLESLLKEAVMYLNVAFMDLECNV